MCSYPWIRRSGQAITGRHENRKMPRTGNTPTDWEWLLPLREAAEVRRRSAFLRWRCSGWPESELLVVVIRPTALAGSPRHGREEPRRCAVPPGNAGRRRNLWPEPAIARDPRCGRRRTREISPPTLVDRKKTAESKMAGLTRQRAFGVAGRSVRRRPGSTQQKWTKLRICAQKGCSRASPPTRPAEHLTEWNLKRISGLLLPQ